MNEQLIPVWDGREREDDICSWPLCGLTADDEGWDTLIYILVLTSPGEEGYAEVTQALCQTHYDNVSQGLIELGFQSHNHHGTNPLEASDCGGYGVCTIASDYGPELVGRRIEEFRCCPIKSTPGRFKGSWTDCIHGLRGKRDELIRELQRVEERIREDS